MRSLVLAIIKVIISAAVNDFHALNILPYHGNVSIIVRLSLKKQVSHTF